VPILIRQSSNTSQHLIGYYKPGSGNIEALPEEKQPQWVEYMLQIYGTGGDCPLSVEPATIDFDIVKINFSKSLVATVRNDSNCTFHLQVQLEEAKDEEENNFLSANRFNLIKNNFKLGFTQGLIMSNNKIDVPITFHPQEVGEHRIALVVYATEKNPKKKVLD